MVPYCTLWYHMVPYGTIWYHMVPFGTLWYHMVPYGTIWYHMVSYGTIWYHMVPYSTIWYHMIFHCSICSIAHVFDFFMFHVIFHVLSQYKWYHVQIFKLSFSCMGINILQSTKWNWCAFTKTQLWVDSKTFGLTLGRRKYLMVPYGTLWYHMVPYGTFWYRMVPFGTFWYLMVL